LRGGKDRRVELQLKPEGKKPRKLSFRAERWTGRSPFVFRVSGHLNGKWHELYSGDKTIKLGGFHTKVAVEVPVGMDRLRLSGNTPEGGGVLIDDVRVQEPKPMELLELTTMQVVTPVLVRNDGDPVLQVKFVAEGSEQPLRVRALRVRLDGTTDLRDIESVSVKYSEAERMFAAPQRPATAMVFRGDQTLVEGESTFIVQVKLKSSANLDHVVDASCDAVAVGTRQVTPEVTSPEGTKRIGVALRKAGDDKCVRYRIPGLDITPKGTLIAVYDARWRSGGDLPGDIDVGMSRSTDGGQTWAPMKIIMDMGNDPAWRYDGIGDPCVMVDRSNGTIWVGATWSHGNRSWRGSGPGMTPEATGQFMLVKSEDDGRTWSKPINITEQIKTPDWCFVLPSPGRGMTMHDGTLVMPSQYQDTLANRRMPHSTIIYSHDRGETWTIGNGARPNTTECRIVELGDGSLMLNMRDNRGGSRAVMTTTDMGNTWQDHSSSRNALPEPVCNAGLIRVEGKYNVTGKDMLIFCNPATTRGRHHMTLKVSLDEGVIWPEEHHLLLDAGSLAGYPSLAMIDQETLGVLYEGSRANLTFQRVKIRDLVKD